MGSRDNIDPVGKHKYITGARLRRKIARAKLRAAASARGDTAGCGVGAASPTASVTTPLYGSVKRFCPPPYDQGSEGSCTANAFCGAYRTICNRLGNSDRGFLPSRQYFYYHERMLENAGTDPSQLGDTGGDVADGADWVAEHGICSEQTWPYIPPSTDASGNEDLSTSNLDTPPAGAESEAAAHRIRSVGTIAASGDPVPAIEAAISQGVPVLLAVGVYASFESPDVARHGMVPTPNPVNYGDPQDPQDAFMGGHEMLIVGYSHREQLFTVLNSWGDSWGHGGFCYLRYDYIRNPNLAFEFKTIAM
jgi:hypothetical protein